MRSPELLRQPTLPQLDPAWFSMVLGLCGLGMAWNRITIPSIPVLIGTLACAIFVALAGASLLRIHRHRDAWHADLRHPVRHTFVATMPISVLVLTTLGVALGLRGPVIDALWWGGSLGIWFVSIWVLSRWWQPGAEGGLQWASATPALFIPVVGSVLVPLAGVPLGHLEWSAAQCMVGVALWPIALALLVVRIAHQGLWPDRLLPTNFILIAPPALIGLDALLFNLPPLVGWAFWGLALFTFCWVLPLLPRIARLPFGMAHWGMSFPLAAFSTLSLSVSSTGPLYVVALGLLGLSTLLIAALLLATLYGLLNGTLLTTDAAVARS